MNAHPKRWTIRVRLTALYGVLFFIAGLVLLAFMYMLVSQQFDRRGGFVPRGPGIANLPNTPLAGTVKIDGRDVPVAEAFARIRAEQDRFQRGTLNSLLTQGALALVGVGAIAIAFGWLLSARALRPIHSITDTARRIAGADVAGRGLHERIALTGPRDEIRELADTFDAMLDRLDRSFDGQRRFVANASHELRTPLAINRALVELAMRRPTASDDLMRLGETLLEVNERNERLIDGLLTLADSENELTTRDRVALDVMAVHVVDAVRARAGDVALGAAVEPAAILGDAVLLERLVSNLIDNAVTHNVAGGWVKVTTRTEGDTAVFTVENTGGTIPPYEVETLFRPFRRLGTERVLGGVGLGLSIVRAVARAHGGDATAEAREDGGLLVTVRLPAAQTTVHAEARV